VSPGNYGWVSGEVRAGARGQQVGYGRDSGGFWGAVDHVPVAVRAGPGSMAVAGASGITCSHVGPP